MMAPDSCGAVGVHGSGADGLFRWVVGLQGGHAGKCTRAIRCTRSAAPPHPTLDAKQALSVVSQEPAAPPLPLPVSPLSRPVPLSMDVAVIRIRTLWAEGEVLKGCVTKHRLLSLM